ncbi:3-keto-5-aminohexanoate cleavage protein [Saccharothrix violaceirubra]|uniref:Uncharacterized protein (DUF849 family) n=1 Tax=Saccharothrix violaceirubra TaxID=413306 RepID=A0A7W7SZF0_9PSEU|nr:3-keto-5-aminohexanoate cleavage protein [Saccharothrix violaceirubra]MBB4963704.1 uncharacterized protein (DUF849 family) [Saccharothrix violaceirubra]
MLQACLNGAREAHCHPALPITPDDLARDAAAVAELGVTHLHLHPRDVLGREVLAGPEIAPTVARVRSAVPHVEIGVTTGAWIEPDPDVRVELVRGWAALAAGRPDVASVNVHEDGWLAVAEALHAAGIGLELGVRDDAAARVLLAAGPPPGTRRVLVEIPADHRVAHAERLLDLLAVVDVPILVHGADDSAWPVLNYAVRRDHATRIGLEDTLSDPDGTPTEGNAALIGHASLGPS